MCFASAGAHTQNHPPAVQRNPFRAAALVLGLLCLLLVAGVIVLANLCEDLVFILTSYIESHKTLISWFDLKSLPCLFFLCFSPDISVTLENNQLQNSTKELQTSNKELQTSYNKLSNSFCQETKNQTHGEKY